MSAHEIERQATDALEDRIKALALAKGASSCGIASVERMKDGPPSADPTYVMPQARSVVAYSIPYDDDILHSFLAKEAFLPFIMHKKETEGLLYILGDHIVALLESEGHTATTVQINAVYRPEPGVDDPSEAVAMIPDFSHRYAAVAAGLGRIGWSGNVLTPEHGAAVVLCSVITDAVLKEDPLLEDNPCDGCRSCVATCPTSMISHREAKTVTMFGLTDEVAEKRTNNACYLGCTDYHGLAPDGKWSNWSPHRAKGGVPDDDQAVDSLCTTFRKNDPNTELFYEDYRDFILDPDARLHSVCGYCSYVCNGPSPKRNRTRLAIKRSGFAVLRVDGRRDIVHDPDAIVEMDTPFGSNIAMLKDEVAAVRRGDVTVDVDGTENIRDQMVLATLKQNALDEAAV